MGRASRMKAERRSSLSSPAAAVAEPSPKLYPEQQAFLEEEFERPARATDRARTEARMKVAHNAHLAAVKELKAARAEFEEHWPPGSHPWWDSSEDRQPIEEEIAKLEGGDLPAACYERCLRLSLVDAAVKSGQLAKAIAERCFRRVQKWSLRVR